MTQSVREFYDRFADDYHLIYPDWRNAVRRQGAVLDRMIRSFLGERSATVLDCACGIGTQAIGLALRGHRVTATDVSERSVDRARLEAKSFDVELDLAVADFRRLEETLTATFDVVVACDNSLPHLTAPGDLARAAASIRGRLNDDGLFIASVRDYDADLQTRPRATEPRVFDGPGGPRVYLQVWEWAADGTTYDVTLFLLRREGGEWSQTTHTTTYRALRRGELAAILAESGFGQIRWHERDETGFFQPVVTARPA